MDIMAAEHTGTRSIRKRLITLSSVVAVLLLTTALYIQNLVDDSSDSTLIQVANSQQLTQKLTNLKDTLQSLERAVYYSSLEMDRAASDRVSRLSESLQMKIEDLSANPITQSTGELRQLAFVLKTELSDLSVEVAGLVEIGKSPFTIYPAMTVLLDVLYPTNVAFSDALELARAESANSNGDKQDDIASLLDELRYVWAQQVSAVRIFVANRSGVFGDPQSGMRVSGQNRKIYFEAVGELLSRLEQFHQQGYLEIQQEVSLVEMKQLHKQYDIAFKEAAEIYTSENWRADLTMLKGVLRRKFDNAFLLVQNLENRLDNHTTNSVLNLVVTGDVVSYFIWAFSIISYLILIGAYVTFEYSVRKPITHIAQALEAYGQDSSYSLRLNSVSEETEMLISAFKKMKGQVELRQKRLELVLDNAGEGILTLNSAYEMVSFNNAAQFVFGYGVDEVIGKPFSILLSDGGGENKKDLMVAVLNEDGENEYTSTDTLMARRKNGDIFPLSIKVNMLMVNGEKHYIVMAEDISERQAMLENLRYLAEHDSLTGIYNRQYFMDELDRLVSRGQRKHDSECALLYIDLDNFKFVNDTLGHIAGDLVLVEVTDLLKHRTRKGDLLGRLGGDEFGIVLYEVDQKNACLAAEFYRRQLAEYQFKHDGRVIDVGCSIGIAILDSDVNSKEDLLARADVACHLAKRRGRNQAHVYELDDQENMDTMYADMGWARKIKNAIEENHFVFACQPIVSVDSGETYCYEVLLRMDDGKDTFIMPSGFLPSAERFGLMLDIDRWIVKKAIETLGLMRSMGEDVRYSVNLSAKAVCDSKLLNEIKELLQLHEVEAESLTFEITENVAISNLHVAKTFLEGLRELGCRTALDDFGVGYSSFAYLKDLPVDLVKIDGSFVKDIEQNPINVAMIKAMNEVSHAMGKRTVAEYVENENIFNILKSLGVDLVQGYYMGEPIVFPESKYKHHRDDKVKIRQNSK